MELEINQATQKLTDVSCLLGRLQGCGDAKMELESEIEQLKERLEKKNQRLRELNQQFTALEKEAIRIARKL